jgi:hypothetical protein
LKDKAADPKVKYNAEGDEVLYGSDPGSVRSSDDAGALFGEFKPWRDNNKIKGYPVNNKHILSPLLIKEQGQVKPHLRSLSPILSSPVRTPTPNNNRTPPRSLPPLVSKAADLSAAIVQDLVTEFQKPHTCS